MEWPGAAAACRGQRWPWTKHFGGRREVTSVAEGGIQDKPSNFCLAMCRNGGVIYQDRLFQVL